MTALSYLIHSYFVSKEIEYKTSKQVLDIVPFILISLIMAAVVYLVGFLEIKPLPLLMLQVVTGFVVTVLCYEWIYTCEEYRDVKCMILKILKIKKK